MRVALLLGAAAATGVALGAGEACCWLDVGRCIAVISSSEKRARRGWVERSRSALVAWVGAIDGGTKVSCRCSVVVRSGVGVSAPARTPAAGSLGSGAAASAGVTERGFWG